MLRLITLMHVLVAIAGRPTLPDTTDTPKTHQAGPNNLTTTNTNSATFHKATFKNFVEQLNQREYAKS
jgi:hypothetical protein